LNEADDDDVDIYDSGLNRGKTRLAYDTTDQNDHEDIIMGGRSNRRGVNLGRGPSKVYDDWILMKHAMIDHHIRVFKYLEGVLSVMVELY
jgi:hypothetical protein